MSKPTIREIEGIYILKSNWAEQLKASCHFHEIPNEVSLEIRKDFSITIINAPTCWLDPFGKSGSKFISGNGTLKIEDSNFVSIFDGWPLSFQIPEGGEIKAGGYINILRLYGSARSHRIWVTLGDPDSGEGFYLEKNAA